MGQMCIVWKKQVLGLHNKVQSNSATSYVFIYIEYYVCVFMQTDIFNHTETKNRGSWCFYMLKMGH